jgi:hypothetical protein
MKLVALNLAIALAVVVAGAMRRRTTSGRVARVLGATSVEV